jgi:hypothetical protein
MKKRGALGASMLQHEKRGALGSLTNFQHAQD